MHCKEFGCFLSSYVIETFILYPRRAAAACQCPSPSSWKASEVCVFLICKNSSLVTFRQNILLCYSVCVTGLFISVAFVMAVTFHWCFPGKGKKKSLVVVVPFHNGTQETWEFACKVLIQTFWKVQSFLKLIIKRVQLRDCDPSLFLNLSKTLAVWIQLVACLFIIGIDEDSVRGSLPGNNFACDL